MLKDKNGVDFITKKVSGLMTGVYDRQSIIKKETSRHERLIAMAHIEAAKPWRWLQKKHSWSRGTQMTEGRQRKGSKNGGRNR
ncbi:MAG: hypothetical protein WD398_15415 [Cyclobacteriaceae bacterium]